MTRSAPRPVLTGPLPAPDGSGDVHAGVLALPDRFLPHEAGDLQATWRLEVTDAATYTVHVRDRACFVTTGASGEAAATLTADRTTWVSILSGVTDGVAAFTAGRLAVDGDLNLALRLETLFRPGPRATRLVRTVQTQVRGLRLESLVAGSGTPVLLLHGLGASKVSFVPTFHDLAARHEVHALDLPGFGKSDRPLPAGRRYSVPWMADVVAGYLGRHRLRSAYVVGNSMGGRIATELAMRHPRSVLGLVNLGAAVAFHEWQWAAPLLRVIRGQWIGLVPAPVRREWIDAGVRDLFHDPTRLPERNLDAAAQEFHRDLGDRRFRLALAGCARSLAAERAYGRGGFWQRLADLPVPSYWIWGASDRLVSPRYAEQVRETLPSARVEVWPDVGHVPQFEVPERTNGAIADFLADLDDADR